MTSRGSLVEKASAKNGIVKVFHLYSFMVRKKEKHNVSIGSQRHAVRGSVGNNLKN